ncbi:MAG: YcxB family protein [Bacilli bacterium]
MEIIANCQYGEERAKQFFRFHMLVKSPIKYIYLGISFLSLAFGVYLIAKNEGYFGIFSFFIAIITIAVWLSVVHTTINKIMKDLHFPMLKYQLLFSESSMTFVQGETKKTYFWSSIPIVCETKTNIYFYINASQALILGKFILSDQDRQQLKVWLTTNQVKVRSYSFK